MSSRAPSTIITEIINGRNEFTIPFEFLARKFVVVTLVGIDRVVLTLNTNYRFVSSNRIQLFQAVDETAYPRIELRRSTSTTDRLVTFVDGSILRATDMNLAQVQTMHVAEEARDLTADTIGVNDEGHLDARNRKVVNMANGTENLDAVNLGQLRQFDTSTGNNADRAEASAATAQAANSQAQTAKDDAAASAAAALQSEEHALVSKENAQAAERQAVEHMNATARDSVVARQAADEAVISEVAAKGHADRAKTEADKLQNMNDFAVCIGNVDTNTFRVDMKGQFVSDKSFAAHNLDGSVGFASYGKNWGLLKPSNGTEVLSDGNKLNRLAEVVCRDGAGWSHLYHFEQAGQFDAFRFSCAGGGVTATFDMRSDGSFNIINGPLRAGGGDSSFRGNVTIDHGNGTASRYQENGDIVGLAGNHIFNTLGRSNLAGHLHNSITDHWYGQTEIVFIGETTGGGTNPGNGRVMVGVWMARSGSNSFMQDAYFRATWVRYNNGAEKIVASF